MTEEKLRHIEIYAFFVTVNRGLKSTKKNNAINTDITKPPISDDFSKYCEYSNIDLKTGERN